MAELWMLYDGDKRPTGKTMVRGEPMPEGYWHIIVSIWTLTADGRLLLTQRSPNKKLALLWEGTAGSVVAGETSLQGALRELREETGLVAEPERVRLLSSEKADRFFIDNYLYLCPERQPKLTLQPEEVVDACFIELSEIDEWKDRLCPPALGRIEKDRAVIEEAAAACRAACS
jgi:8-oxo-dGTP pyrophosphatase MutT (NUDIX family)